jgi:hypothetical protein
MPKSNDWKNPGCNRCKLQIGHSLCRIHYDYKIEHGNKIKYYKGCSSYNQQLQCKNFKANIFYKIYALFKGEPCYLLGHQMRFIGTAATKILWCERCGYTKAMPWPPPPTKKDNKNG